MSKAVAAICFRGKVSAILRSERQRGGAWNDNEGAKTTRGAHLKRQEVLLLGQEERKEEKCGNFMKTQEEVQSLSTF
jgi:hypothetical protein